jgi:hypothetical protein
MSAPLTAVDARRYHYIDDTPLDLSEDSSVGDDDLYSEDLDDTRVEDEDWEIAERGRKILSYRCEDMSFDIFFFCKTLPNNTIVYDNIFL